MAKLQLEDMEFYAFHGHYPEEQAIGGKYSVDLTIETNTDQAETSDDLTDTIDYTELYQIVKSEMGKPARIMEHLARRIINSVKDRMKNISSITVKLSKINPPAGGKMDRFSIIISE